MSLMSYLLLLMYVNVLEKQDSSTVAGVLSQKHICGSPQKSCNWHSEINTVLSVSSFKGYFLWYVYTAQPALPFFQVSLT